MTRAIATKRELKARVLGIYPAVQNETGGLP
jgi:hypothetical protein